MGDYREKESVRGKTQNVEEEGEGEEHGQVVKLPRFTQFYKSCY